jgi:uncharacterized DUF497 family protein
MPATMALQAPGGISLPTLPCLHPPMAYAQVVRFTWDSDKEAGNRARHGVDFSTAAAVFSDPLAVTDYDDEHSLDGEDRWTTIGMVGGLLMLVRVTWTDREGEDIVRIISARLAGPSDRARYHES